MTPADSRRDHRAVRSLFSARNSLLRPNNSLFGFQGIMSELTEIADQFSANLPANKRDCGKFPVFSLINRELPPSTVRPKLRPQPPSFLSKWHSPPPQNSRVVSNPCLRTKAFCATVLVDERPLWGEHHGFSPEALFPVAESDRAIGKS